jgi:hypothetical protein
LNPPVSTSTTTETRAEQRHGHALRPALREFSGIAIAEQPERKRHAEPADVRRNGAEPALVLAGAEIDVDPGDRVRDEALEEARGVDVVAAAFDGTLLDVGNLAFQRFVEVLV